MIMSPFTRDNTKKRLGLLDITASCKRLILLGKRKPKLLLLGFPLPPEDLKSSQLEIDSELDQIIFFGEQLGKPRRSIQLEESRQEFFRLPKDKSAKLLDYEWLQVYSQVRVA